MLNEQSKYSYDSEYMQNIQNTSKNITADVIVIAENPSISSDSEALASVGNKAEEIYNENIL